MDRDSVIREIEWLMDARGEYSGEIIEQHMNVVKHLVRVLRDEPYAAEGWLPSWRWDEYKALRAEVAE